QQRGLTAAVGTEDDDPLPLLDDEVEPAEIDLGLIGKDVPHARHVHDRIGRARRRMGATGMLGIERVFVIAHGAPRVQTAAVTIKAASATGTQSSRVLADQCRQPHTRPEWPRSSITAYTRWLRSKEKRTSVPMPCPRFESRRMAPPRPHPPRSRRATERRTILLARVKKAR